MIIKSMTATFGCLNQASLTLTDGVNLINLPNESGKSTWCAFIRVMLYGINTRERDKKDSLADKTRYLPWSGAPMSGEMICNWKGRDIRIRRFTTGTTPMNECEITYLDDGCAVPELNSNNLGDVMIGVSRLVFERSAFIDFEDMVVTQTPELEKRLAAIVSSGEDGVSASVVGKQLQDWQRRRQYRTRGEIPELESSKALVVEKIEGIKDSTAVIRRCQSDIEKYSELCIQLEHQIELHHAIQNVKNAKAVEAARVELAAAWKEEQAVAEMLPEECPGMEPLTAVRDDVAYLEKIESELKSAIQEVENAERVFAGLEERTPIIGIGQDAKAIAVKVEEVEGQISTLEDEAAKAEKMSKTMPLLGVLFGAVGFIVLYAVGRSIGIVAILALLIFVIAGIACGLIFKNKTLSMKNEIQTILGTYGVGSVLALREHAEQDQHWIQEKERVAKTIAEAHDRVTHLEAMRNEMCEGIMEFVHLFAPDVVLLTDAAEAINRIIAAKEKLDTVRERRIRAEQMMEMLMSDSSGETIAEVTEEPTLPLDRAQDALRVAKNRISAAISERDMAVGRRGTLGDPDMLQTELDRINREITKKTFEYDALSIAMQALMQSGDIMTQRFSPDLNRIAGAYFAAMTSGRYEAIRLNRDLEASADESGSVMSRSVLSLSQGTKDQLWFAVHLAICEIALPEDECCPLVLDDAFLSFDDTRTENAIKLIKEMSRKRQVILFSGQSREQRIWESI